MGSLRSNPVLQGLRRTLDAEGIPFTVEHGGKHPFVSFEVGGRRVRYPFAASTGDQRAHLAACSQVRRIIRTMKETT